MANQIVITPDSLKKSAEKFRKELLTMPAVTLMQFINLFSVRTGIRYKETVGELSGDIQIGPYSATRKDNSDIKIAGRTLETFLGSVIKDFEPNQVVSSIYGDLRVHGDALKNVDIARAVLTYLMGRISANLYKNLFSAKRNDGGTTTAELFNGFDTIIDTEKTAGNIAEGQGNMLVVEAFTKENTVDQLKKFFWSADENLQMQDTIIYLPPTIYNYYNEDYKATTGATPYNTEYKKVFLEGSDNRCTLQPLSAKADCKYIQLTTRQNSLIGCGNNVAGESLDVDRFSSFVLTFSTALFFGCQYESISKERIHVATIDGTTPLYTKDV